MSTEDDMKASTSEQQSLSCSMTFQNAIEIDFSKLREMAKQEAQEKENSTSKEGEKDAKKVNDSDVEEEEMTEQLSASILTSTAHVERDLSIYDRALESHDPDSSSDDDEEEFRKSAPPRTDDAEEEEEDTEVENSHSDEDEDAGAQYEQLGSTEFTKQHSQDEDDGDGDGAHSDGEFGEFESCPPVTYQMMSSADHTADEDSDQVEVEEVQLEDRTQDVLGNYHPRTAATAIPPLDQDKIALIKNTMAGLKLKPLANAGRVADAVIRAKPRVGDELNHNTSK